MCPRMPQAPRFWIARSCAHTSASVCLDALCALRLHCSIASKREPQGKLHYARIAGERGDLAGCASAEVGARRPEDRGVEQVERLPAKLEPGVFADDEILQQREIEDIDMRPAQAIAARVAKLSRLLQLESICCVRRERVAHRILGSVEPAVHIADDQSPGQSRSARRYSPDRWRHSGQGQ